MEPANKSGKRRGGKRKNRKIPKRPPEQLLDLDAWSPEQSDPRINQQALTGLHVACLYGQLPTIRLLVESGLEGLDYVDSQGRQPIHMVLTYCSSTKSSACLRYLLENGADVNITTDLGLSPLHIAASEGLLECTEMLVKAGADVLAKDEMGHTPLDLARIWCHRKVARYLKSCMWTAEKSKEMEERQQAQALYCDLVNMAKENNLNQKTINSEKVAEWARKKGFAVLKDLTSRVQVSQYHSHCCLSDQDSSDLTYAKSLHRHQPRKPAFRPWTIYTGLQKVKSFSEPDLRDFITVWTDGSSRQAQYNTKCDSTPRAAPDLPLDVLERVLFPRAFPSRIMSPEDFEPQSILGVQHRGWPQGRITSPWTEVAMHLAEVLEPGHY